MQSSWFTGLVIYSHRVIEKCRKPIDQTPDNFMKLVTEATGTLSNNLKPKFCYRADPNTLTYINIEVGKKTSANQYFNKSQSIF